MAGYERTIERTRALLRPSDTVLEIGCGTGTTALKLAPSVGNILGTDVSAQMVAIANGKVTAGGPTNARFEVSTAHRLPLADASCNAVLAFSILHLVADRAAVIAEAHRVLRPGGLFISKTPCLTEMNPLIRLAVPVMRFVGLAPTVTTFGAEELVSAVTDGGFDLVARERHGSMEKDSRIFIVGHKTTTG